MEAKQSTAEIRGTQCRRSHLSLQEGGQDAEPRNHATCKDQPEQLGGSFRRDLHRLKAFLLGHWKSLDQLLIILKLEKSPNNHSFKIARTLSIDTSLFEMECILKNMKNKSHLSEIIYESYLHTIFLTTLIFLLTIGYARKHLVHHCSYNSKAGICIS